MANAVSDTCSQGGDSCRAPKVDGLSLLQYQHVMGQAPEKAAADDAKAPAEAAKDAAAPADAKAAADATTTAAAATDATTTAAATTTGTGNATANETNVTTAAPVTGCATKNDPRASAWFAETSPDGTACVFAADTRDEGSHCIMSDGEYGSNGWCWTNLDQSTWGSCNDLCPLYGPAAKLGTKIDGVAEVVKDIHGMLNSSGASDETTTAAPAADETTAAPAADAKAEAKEAAKGAKEAAKEALSQVKASLEVMKAPASAKKDEAAEIQEWVSDIEVMQAPAGAKKAAEGALSLLRASLTTEAKQDPKAPAADAKAAPAADAKAAPAADAKAAPAADAKAAATTTAAPEAAATTTSAANATNATNVTGGNATEEPASSGCQTKEDERVASWFTETAPAGTACIFGVDVRDEGGHCIYSEGEFGSNGWCFTNKDATQWGSCNEHCPLYGAPKHLGTKIDAVTEIVSKVNKHIEEQLNGTASSEEATATTAAPAGDATTAAPAADAKEAPKTTAKAGF